MENVAVSAKPSEKPSGGRRKRNVDPCTIVLYLTECRCGKRCCQENAAYAAVRNKLKNVSLKEVAVEFLVEYKKQQTISQNDSCLHDGHWTLLQDILQKCEDIRNSLGQNWESDPLTCSANIIWNSPEMTTWIRNRHASRRGEWVLAGTVENRSGDEKHRRKLLFASSHRPSTEANIGSYSEEDDEVSISIEEELEGQMNYPRRSMLVEKFPHLFRLLQRRVIAPITSDQALDCSGQERFNLVMQTNPIEGSYFLSDGGGYTHMFWNTIGPDARYLAKDEHKGLLEFAVGHIRDQMDHIICWAYASCDLISSVRVLHGLDQSFVPLSPLFLCQNLNQRLFRLTQCETDGTHGCYGGEPRLALLYAKKFGVTREMPGCEEFDCTDIKGLFSSDQELYKVQDVFCYPTIESALERMQTGYPVVAGLKLFHGFEEYHHVHIHDDMKIYYGPKAGTKLYCDHAVLMISFKELHGEKVVICKSSNGENGAGFIAVSLQIMILAVGASEEISTNPDEYCNREPQYLLTDFFSVNTEMGEKPLLEVDQNEAAANLQFKIESCSFRLRRPIYSACSPSWKKRVDVGTGSQFELIWNQTETGLVKEEETDAPLVSYLLNPSAVNAIQTSAPHFLQFIFETYCKIHQRIDMGVLAEKLNLNYEEAERWIVNLIRTSKLDANIDSESRTVIMEPTQPNVHEQLINHTKGLDLFTSEEQELLSDVEPMIMRTLRKIMHLPGYPDGEPISDSDKTFVLEKI